LHVIGLTGGIGAGKSAVAAVLQRLGAHVIDADREGHEAYAPGTMGWHRIIAMFGEDLLTDDSHIDRRKLGQLVFGSPQALAWLNSAIHPLIRERIKGKLDGLKDGGCRVAVIDAAVLVQAGWDDLTDEVWTVKVPIEVATERVASSRGLMAWEVRGRIEAQQEMVRQAEARADVVIDNAGTLEELQAKVEQLWNERNLPKGGTHD
jgi:dephospho-CoA kinase